MDVQRVASALCWLVMKMPPWTRINSQAEHHVPLPQENKLCQLHCGTIFNMEYKLIYNKTYKTRTDSKVELPCK